MMVVKSRSPKSDLIALLKGAIRPARVDDGLLPEASPVFDAMADGRSRSGGWSTGRRTFGRRP